MKQLIITEKQRQLLCGMSLKYINNCKAQLKKLEQSKNPRLKPIHLQERRDNIKEIEHLFINQLAD
jgi:hypothetical protein